MDFENKKAGLYAALLFIVWPFLAMVSAFRNYREYWGKNILWAFVAFYGLSFAIGAESQSSDIVRYVQELKNLNAVSMSFPEAFSYIFQSGNADYLNTFIAVILSRITDSQAVLTLVYGIIFGFFFSRNMWYVLERLEGKIQPITVLLFSCFFLVIPIWNMNGFRMWTAAHIFIYGLMPYLFENKKSGLLISISAILVHFSFIVPVFVLAVYLLLRNRLTIYFGFFVLTFFISEIDIEFFNQVVESYTPEIVQERTSDYRSESAVEAFRRDDPGKKNWYVVWYGRALKWSVMGFLVVLFFYGRSFFAHNKNWMNLFSFTLLYYGCANLLSSLPSGGRFTSIANMIALALIIIYIQNMKHNMVMKRIIWAAIPALSLFIIVAFRTGLYSMSATSVLGNPVLALFMMGEFISLNDFVKMLL